MRRTLLALSCALVSLVPAQAQKPAAPDFILKLEAGETRARLVQGEVIGFNGPRGVIQIRRPDRSLYYLNTASAEFRAYTGGEQRPAELIDIRPGQRVEARGIIRPNGIVDVNLVLIREQPARLRTADPFAPTTPTAQPATMPSERVAGQIAEALLAIRGTVLSVDAQAGTMRVRTGEEVMTVRTGTGTEYRGIAAKAPGLAYFRPGDVVTVDGIVDGTNLTAERITLASPDAPMAVQVEVTEAPEETGAFTGTLLSMDKDRTRARLRLTSGERVVIIRETSVTRNALTVGRKALKPGMRLLVRAERRGADWIATEIRIL